jgi:hypothetical protein
MGRLLTCLLILVSGGWNAGGAIGQGKPEASKSSAELEKRLEELEREVQALAAIIEGTAKPINLGRTSLAAVTASSVNGGRALHDKFYGIVNAFDNGSNWHNSINYTYWLATGGTGQWVEVRFDSPVTVTSIHVEGNPGATSAWSARLSFAKGGEASWSPENHDLRLPQPAHGVTAIRLSFSQASTNLLVNEIRIMGYVRPDTEYSVARPRILVTRRSAQAIATQEYETWRLGLASRCVTNTTESDGAVVVTYSIAGHIVFRVTVNKHDGTVIREAFVKLVPFDPVTVPK